MILGTKFVTYSLKTAILTQMIECICNHGVFIILRNEYKVNNVNKLISNILINENYIFIINKELSFE